MLFMPNNMFAAFHRKKNWTGTTEHPERAQWWLFAICSTVIACSCAWQKIFEKSRRLGEAGWSPSRLQMVFLSKISVWLQKSCSVTWPRSAGAGRSRLYHSPAVTLAHTCQLRVINAAGILWGLISTLHTALNALQKIQRKCKAMCLHGSTLSSANSMEKGGAYRYWFRVPCGFSELPSGNPSLAILTV